MSDFIDRENAIDVLEILADKMSDEGKIVMAQAVAVLKDLQPAEPERKTFHVIDKTTGKEADPYEIALKEDWAKSLCYCDMEGFAILEDGTLILADECGRFEFIQENDRFEIVWDEVTDER